MWLERWLYTLPLRWRSIVRRQQIEQDLDDELRYHVECQINEQIAGGVEAGEARRRALRTFGGVDQAKESCRDVRGSSFVEALGQDLRDGARTLRCNPGFATAAVLTLALGSGANTAVFSLIDGILLSRLPYPAPDRLVSVTGTYPNGAFAEMRETVKTLDVAAYREGHSFTLKDGGDPVRVAGTRISAGLFPLLGVRPALGRWLRPGEDIAGQDHYVILSHSLWQTRFGNDEAMVDRFIELEGIRRQVIAVMPQSFQFPSSTAQIWVPLGTDSRNTARYWAGDFMPVIGRLRPGTTISQAQSDIGLFQSRIPASFPWKMPADWNRNVSVMPLKQALVGAVREELLILIAAVALVLIIACANVANLTLSKTVAREREIGIRAAIGAGPRRIARQLITESVLLAFCGAAAGILVGTQAVAVLKLVLPPDTPRLNEVHFNWRVLVFTGVVAILTGCAFGLAPVQQALRLRLWSGLKAGGRDRGQTVAGPVRTALTIAQIACAVVLVISAALVVRSLWTLSRVDPGFTADDVVTARISPSESLCGSPAQCLAFYRSFEEEMRTSAQINSVALVNTLPLSKDVAKRSLEIEGYIVAASEAAPLFWLNVVTPDYFGVMDIRVEAGRAFTRSDLAGPRVAIVTKSSAQRFWPSQNAVGRHVRFLGERDWRTIVGVAADVRAYDLKRNVPEWIAGTIYVPYDENATMEDGHIPTQMTLALRTSRAGAQVDALLRQASRRVSSDVVVDESKPMRGIMADAVAAPAATMSLLVTMASLALVLGCIGVYGVLSFLVSRRTRDLGIRLALGAQRQDLFWLVMKEGGRLCAAGITVGVAGAVAITRWLSSELYGVSPTDPATYAVVAFVVSVVTLMACYVPTRRAMRVDPLIVLRDQ